jgi:hypothetical protein
MRFVNDIDMRQFPQLCGKPVTAEQRLPKKERLRLKALRKQAEENRRLIRLKLLPSCIMNIYMFSYSLYLSKIKRLLKSVNLRSVLQNEFFCLRYLTRSFK